MNQFSSNLQSNPLHVKFQHTFDHIFSLMTSWTSSWDHSQPISSLQPQQKNKIQSNLNARQQKGRQKSPFVSKDKSQDRSRQKSIQSSGFPSNFYQQKMVPEQPVQPKQVSEREIEIALGIFQKMVSHVSSISQNMSSYIFGGNCAFLSQIYQCYLIIFVNAQKYLDAKHEAVFKAFYSMIRIGSTHGNQFSAKEDGQVQKKVATLIQNVLQFCSIGEGVLDTQKNYSDNVTKNLQYLFLLYSEAQIANPTLTLKQRMFKLVLKAAQKQWNHEIIPIFFSIYLQRLEDYSLGKNKKQQSVILIHNLSQLSKVLTTKYKFQTTSVINKLVKHVRQNQSSNRQKMIMVNYYLLIQLKSNPQLFINILKQQGFTLQIGNLYNIKINGKSLSQTQQILSDLQTQLLSRYYQCFIQIFKSDQKLYEDIQKLEIIYPLKNAKTGDQVWSNLLLNIFLKGNMRVNNGQPLIDSGKGMEIIQWMSTYANSIGQSYSNVKHLTKLIEITVLLYLSLGDYLFPKGNKSTLIYNLKQIINKKHLSLEQLEQLNFVLQDTLQIAGFQQQTQLFNKNSSISKIYEYLKMQKTDFMDVEGQNQQETNKVNTPSVSKLSNTQIFEVCNLLILISRNYTNQFMQQNNTTIPPKKFPTLSYQLFNIINITPKDQIAKPVAQALRIQHPILAKAIAILQKLVKQYGFEMISPIVKKCLSIHYDKINQFTLKQNYNCNNGLFIKIIVLVGIKIKTIADILLRKSSSRSQRLTDLEWVFTKVPTEVLPQYCSYLATKDRYKFSLEIFEKNLLKYQNLIKEVPGKMIF